MFNRTTSTNFFAPRRQARKEKILALFSELGVLCAFARVIFSGFRNPEFNEVWLGFSLARGADFPGAPGDERLHLTRCAVVLEVFFKDLVYLVVFVPVLDLPTTFLNAPVGEIPTTTPGRVQALIT